MRVSRWAPPPPSPRRARATSGSSTCARARRAWRRRFRVPPSRRRGEVAEVLDALAIHQPEVVFNVCEAPLGRPDREAHVAALLEWSAARFTGSGSETLALCRRKDRANALLAQAGVPVPRPGVFPASSSPRTRTARPASTPIRSARMPRRAGRARAPASPGPPRRGVPPRPGVRGRPLGAYRARPRSIGDSLPGGLRLNTYAAKWDTESADFRARRVPTRSRWSRRSGRPSWPRAARMARRRGAGLPAGGHRLERRRTRGCWT